MASRTGQVTYQTTEKHRTPTSKGSQGLPPFYLPPPCTAITVYQCPAGPPSNQRGLRVIVVTKTRTRSGSGQAQTKC